MKRIPPGVALALVIGIAPLSCARRAAAPARAIVPVAAMPAAAAPPADLFLSDVKPLLMRKCAPCHAPGGQMYARMPFDEAATVREHREGILRRLKADGAPVERWLATTAR